MNVAHSTAFFPRKNLFYSVLEIQNSAFEDTDNASYLKINLYHFKTKLLCTQSAELNQTTDKSTEH